MTVVTKEILAEIGVMGTQLPRSLVIPMIAAVAESTDLLNILMEVMEMLTEDPEIAKIVANQWNLGFEIKAFNVQKQVWDLLDPDDTLEIPQGASIQVNVFNNDPEEENPPASKPEPELNNISRRDPRRKNREVEIQLNTSQEDEAKAPALTSRRDPRRKGVSAEPEIIKVSSSEPNVQNLSRNDPRRRKLMEKSSVPLIEPERPKAASPKAIAPTDPRRLSHPDSDSDDNELQIDESIDPHHQASQASESVLITESQIEIDQKASEAVKEDDVELWDEIYGNIVGDEKKKTLVDSPSAPSVHPIKKTDILPKEDEKSDNFKPFEDRKSIEQLERERELLLTLVKERDRMNEIVASVPTPEEIILDNDDLEEGELSDSGEEEDEKRERSSDEVEIVSSVTELGNTKRRRSFIGIVDPEELIPPTKTSSREKEPIQIPLQRFSAEKVEITPVRNTVNIDLEDFTSPASPTGIQLNLDNDEIDVIPLERDDQDKNEEPDVVEVPPAEKYKHYWEEFSQEERKVKEKPSPKGGKVFDVAREKLSNFSKDSPKTSKHTAPTELFMKAALGLKTNPGSRPFDPSPQINFVMQEEPRPVRHPPSKPTGHQGITPLLPSQPPGVHTAVLPQFPPPAPATMRKGIALLETPGAPFPQPVKAVSSSPASSASSLNSPPGFNSSVPPPTPSNLTKPPPTPSNLSKPLIKQNSNPKKIPSLLNISVNNPNDEKQPKQTTQIWQDGCAPTGSAVQIKKEEQAQKSNKHIPKRTVRKKRSRSRSRNRGKQSVREKIQNEKKVRGKSPRSERSRRSRSRDKERRSKDRDKRSRSTSRRSESSEKRPKRRSGSRGRRSNSKDKDRRSKSRERDRNTRNPKSRRNSGNKDSNSKEQKVKNSNHEPLGKKDSNPSNLRQVNFVRKPFEANPDLEKREDLDKEFELMGKRQEALINFVRKPFEKEQDESSAAIARPSLLPEPVRTTNFFMSSLDSNPGPSHPTNFALYSPIRTPNFAPGPSSSSLNFSPFTTNSSPSAIRPFSPAQHPRPFSPSQTPRPFSSHEPFAKNPSPPFTPNRQQQVPFSPTPSSLIFNSPSRGGSNFGSPPAQTQQQQQGNTDPINELTSTHPIAAIYEFSRKMNYPIPKFMERYGPVGGWAFDVEVGGQTFSCPWFKEKKKDAKSEGSKYALHQLGCNKF